MRGLAFVAVLVLLAASVVCAETISISVDASKSLVSSPVLKSPQSPARIPQHGCSIDGSG
jgi:hypothetical protein